MGTKGLVLLFIIGLLIYLITASEFKSIAEMKGHSSSKYFWYSFLFGPAGWCMVIALPDRKGAQAVNADVLPGTTDVADELPDL